MSPNRTINCSGQLIDLTVPKVMGIINLTPDSFYKASQKEKTADVLATAEQMLSEGATFLDLGGYSSRPGAEDIPPEEEMDRVLAPIAALKRTFPDAVVSVDTFRAEVAKKAVEAGADIINDISAGHLDDQMLRTVAELGVPYIAMHMKGTPQTMQSLASYDDVVHEVAKYFSKVLRNCNELGIKDVLIDPGFGFAKDADHSFHLLRELAHLQWLDKPLLVGVSRKSMIYRTLEGTAEQALNGTTVLNTVALMNGASILRVHDVKPAMEAIKLTSRLK